MRRIIFADPIAGWVPWVTVLAICLVTWGGLWWRGMPGDLAFLSTLGLGAVLLLLMLLQGWLYWKRDIESLALVGGEVEARIAKWIGPSPTLRFSPSVVKEWRVISTSSASSKKPGVPNLGFLVNDREYRMSLFSAKKVDFTGLRELGPAFFDRLLDSDPSLRALGN
jgi:hypothetical protein